MVLPAILLSLSMAGLPFTGGALAKLAVKTPLGSGLVGDLATLSAAGTALLMLHFLRRLWSLHDRDEAREPALMPTFAWLALAFLSQIGPWFLYPLAGGVPARALTLPALWEGFWPFLSGSAITFVLMWTGLRLPALSAGDVLLTGAKWFRAAFSMAGLFERADLTLRHWHIAAFSLVTIALLFAAAALTK